VKYNVKIIGDTLSIRMNSEATGNLPLNDIDLGKRKLSSFYFVDALIDCTLDLQNSGSYSGHCNGLREQDGI
jgi:hypothetical protein